MKCSNERSDVPVWSPPKGAPLFSIKDMAGIHGFGHLTVETAERQIEDFRNKRLIEHCKVGAHRTYFYAPLQVMKFRVLSECYDTGMCLPALQAIAIGCDSWSDDNPHPRGASPAPLWQAAIECWDGAMWGLSVQCWRSDQGAPRHFAAFVSRVPDCPRPSYLSDDYRCHVHTTVVLSQIINPVRHRMTTLALTRGVIQGDAR